jgi:hypothetical protein
MFGSEHHLDLSYDVLGDQGIFVIHCKGVNDPQISRGMMGFGINEMEELKLSKMLIDFREVVNKLTKNQIPHRPQYAEALNVPKHFAYAIVVDKETELTAFFEEVFRDSGFNIETFSDYQQAINWLKAQA